MGRGSRRLLALLFLLGPMPARAERPLPERIDALIAARAGGPVAKRATDAEFLRRIDLDLAGVIPTADDARRFLDDANPEKRAARIDALLAGPDHARRLEQALTVALLERREGTLVPARDWSAFLHAAIAANRPWDMVVRDLIRADGDDPATQGALKFFADTGRDDHHRLTQDVARLFLGMNLQCAQCHDHPTIDDYTQADYFGLYTFLNQGRVRVDPKSKQVQFVEQVHAGRSEFASVFKTGVTHQTGPRLPGGAEVEIPKFAKGDEFATPPVKDGPPGVPKFRARALLADQLVAPENPRFARHAVNRFWFLMMGRGLVHPLDLDHAENPPSHPELLDLLTREFQAHGHDVRWLLRTLARTETYQRSSLLPDGADPAAVPPESYRAALPKPLSAEQLAWSLLRGTGHLDRVAAAPKAETTSFNFKDYVNGRIKSPPATLTDTVALFAAVFGNPPGEPEVEFNPSLGQSLFLMNERLVLGWLAPSDGNLAARLAALDDSAQCAETLYLSLLTRRPDPAEAAEVAEYLDQNPTRRTDALAELAWALLGSAEFRLNH